MPGEDEKPRVLGGVIIGRDESPSFGIKRESTGGTIEKIDKLLEIFVLLDKHSINCSLYSIFIFF